MAPSISPYTGPGWSQSFLPGAIAAPVGVLCFTVRHSAVFMASILSVSLTPGCPLCVTPIPGGSLGTCGACDWLALLSSSSLFQDSVICADLWSRQSGPDASTIDIGVALALSPSITVVMTPCYCGMLGGLHILFGSSTYPSLGRMLGPSSIGLWLCWRLGCRPVPSSHFLDSVYYLACSLDSSSYGFLR